jgi:hypothetical protein
VAMTSAPALAADAVPAVSFEGWVDTIFSISDNDADDNDATAKDEESLALRFSAAASLKANWKVTDALTARVNLWFNPSDDATEVDVVGLGPAAGSTNANGLNLREAYFAWALNDTVTWSMGKYIDHIGWLSAEPTGLYTVNASLIGYTSTYGNDVIGTSIAVAPKDSPISGSFHLTNGYYTTSDALNGGPSDNRENTDLGFGLDLIYNLPQDLGSLNLEFAYDMHSDLNPVTDGDGVVGMGGDVFLVGLNATIKPAKAVLIGAELQYQMLGEADDEGLDGATGDTDGTDADRLQGLILVNYTIDGAPVPMSISGMIQYVQVEPGFDDSETESRIGGAVALLTNPLNSSNFGLNFEIGLYDVSDSFVEFDGADAVYEDDTGFVVSVEGLVTF